MNDRCAADPRRIGEVLRVVIDACRPGSAPFGEHAAELVETLARFAALAIGRLQELEALREDSLRPSKSRFARLEQAGILEVIVTDLSTRVVEANDTVLRMVGYSREEVLADDFHWADLSAPESADIDILAMSQLQECGVAGLREKQYIWKGVAMT